MVALVHAGTVLAERYLLEQRVGSGGMGEVWRAFDRVLNRTVAVKCLLGGAPDEPSFVDQFRAEARIMATISHPGVVEVYDFGDDPAVGVYLVMKFIDGESLAQTLARIGRLSAEATMRLVAEAAEALYAAHEKGVTHRDIKAGNLLLGPGGSTLVTDFGIARSADATGHTATGLLTGTAGYIAPERAMGQKATPASDIYSLGVVAYRCLAGHLPFVGDSVVEVALQHVHKEPPPLPSDVPPSVRAVVERAMAKDPAMRWPSGAVLAREARRVLAQDPLQRQSAEESAPIRPQAMVPVPTGGEPAAGGRGGRRLLVSTVVGLVIAIIATAGLILSRPDHPQSQSIADGAGARTTSPAGGDATKPAAGLGATRPTASPSATIPVPSSGATIPKAGAGTTSLAAPSDLTATPISASTIRLRWKDMSAGEGGFTVINGVTSRNVGANKTTYDWTGLAPDTYMCFKVRAYNSSGYSDYSPAAQSEWVCVTSLRGTGPAAPTNLTATAPNAGTIRLQWTDNSSNENGFAVINGQTSRNVGANTTTYDWTGLAPGTYMCFKVRAYNSSGYSDYSPAAQSEWVCLTTPST